MRPAHKGGFTLIELMIVVSVISIISAIAIPRFLGARSGGLEAGAIASLRSLSTASELYRTRFGEYPGATTGDPLGDLSNAALRPVPYIDAQLGSGQKGGYLYMFVTAGQLFSITADPVGIEEATRSFFVDQSGVIRVESNFATHGSATPASPTLD